MNKKGNAVIAILFFAFLLIAVAISSSYLLTPLEEISDDIQADATMSTEAKELIVQAETGYQGLWDGMLFFAVIVLWIFNFISAFFVYEHPIFFVITLILMFFAFYAVALLANEYEALTSEGELLEHQQYYTKTTFIMNHLLEIAVIMGASYIIPLYVRLRS